MKVYILQVGCGGCGGFDSNYIETEAIGPACLGYIPPFSPGCECEYDESDTEPEFEPEFEPDFDFGDSEAKE